MEVVPTEVLATYLCPQRIKVKTILLFVHNRVSCRGGGWSSFLLLLPPPTPSLRRQRDQGLDFLFFSPLPCLPIPPGSSRCLGQSRKDNHSLVHLLPPAKCLIKGKAAQPTQQRKAAETYLCLRDSLND
ncbi:hypothetical protein M408DRAFT_129922 [Serendipita vermifera MAFF 305830]|uniref:Uncharacterized protein n=1 Tax=Serendipita vermifera MAFF 305830 TaxID=933852 RepID=A0A0C3AKS2_SERVB|nr:hypothetical protein M408DRAFT_129922 [Serendipita vermifera MAFF 305830]